MTHLKSFNVVIQPLCCLSGLLVFFLFSLFACHKFVPCNKCLFAQKSTENSALVRGTPSGTQPSLFDLQCFNLASLLFVRLVSFQHRKCSSSHNSLRGIHPSSPVNILLRTVSTVIARCYLHLRWYFFIPWSVEPPGNITELKSF